MDLEKAKNLNIPKTPGCYLFREREGVIIYVGKAVDLRSRVLSYFREATDHSPAKFAMVKRIVKIDWVTVDSEIEALLLEANLIKKHKPEFNVVMRDDKRHVYIKVSTEDEYPRIFLARSLDKSGRYFGPFVSTESVREVLKIIRKIWPYRSCATMPKKACLYYRIGKCQGMCEKFISAKDYNKIIKEIILFLEGKKYKIISNFKFQILNLEKRIKKLDEKSGEKEILQEELNRLNYQLLNINKVLASTNVLSLMDKYAADVVELAKILNLPTVPERIEGYDISNVLGQEAVGSMVVFAGGEPDKNEYRKFKIRTYTEANDVGMLKEVMERRLKHSLEFPLSGPLSVKGVGGILKRGNKAEWPLPDLIIIDGGKGQLNGVMAVLKKFKVDIPVIAISKGEGLRSALAPDKIFFPGEKKPLELPLASPALHIIKRVRDEAHRFAIGFHRDLRSKRMFRR